jgi:hypothetical protein
MVRSFPTVPALVAAMFVISVSGCNCNRNNTLANNYGEIGVVWRDATNTRIVDRAATYDFGTALTGDRKQLSLTVTNVGSGKLTLSKLELTSGDPTAIMGTDLPGNTTAFEVHLTAPVEIDPAGQADFDMFFTPKVLQGTFNSVLTLTGEGTRAEDSTASITLLGKSEKGACDLPTSINFGKVALGETFPFTVPFVNSTTVDATGNAGDITGADATSFGYAPNSPKGVVQVAAMMTKNVVVTFSPTEKRLYSAQVVMRGPGACPDTTITLTGEGSDATLSWTPSSLTYGNVAPGNEVVKEVVFTNPASVPLTLTMVSSTLADFYQAVPAGTNATTFTVQPNSAPTSMKIACNPAVLGHRVATLSFQTGLVHTPTGVIALDCMGGGPRIKVTPNPTLNFGLVGYFPGTPSFNVTRKVNVQNVGTMPAVPDPAANLFLGQVSAGTVGNLPLFDITPTNATTDASELMVALGSPYNTTNGLAAVAGANFVDLVVTLNPKSIGMKAADLNIYSNDPGQPTVTVHLTADVQQLPPCTYTVSPATANFGLVTPGTTKDLPINITNTGTQTTDHCYLSGIDLAAGSDLAFSIVGGPVVSVDLMPQQTYQVVVRVSPQGAVPTSLQTLTGALTFNITSPTTPQAVVPLRASVGPSCLVVTPDPLDFGTVKVGCSPAPRTLNIYNVCSTNVTISSFAMQSAGGLPFGPGCTNAAGCPEFFLSATPMIPAGGLTLAPGAAPVTFQARYSPIDVGSDSGSVAINALQNGQSITYLVTLQGAGDTMGLETDTFTQDQQPKADILLVVDDSGSMADKQASLAANFSSFIQYAVAANVDYHLAVTTTTANFAACGGLCTSVAKDGELELDSVLNTRYLTPASPNVSAAFSRMVNVGTNGSGVEQGLEAATFALTPPLVSGLNAGFLRDPANLAVVVVSDAADQSDQPVSYYQNRLINVKGFNRLSMFTFSDIGPYLRPAPDLSATCQYDGSYDPVLYDTVVAATAGIKDEICNANWSSALQRLGQTVFGFRTQFYLNSKADTTKPIVVQVNGMTVATGPNTWTYDSGTNSVKFNPAATPGPGQTMTVTYTTLCM